MDLNSLEAVNFVVLLLYRLCFCWRFRGGENRTHKAGRNAGVLLRSDDGAQTWREVGSATPEDPLRKFGYSNLNWNSLIPRVLAGQDSDGSRGRLSVGLTYETEAEGCDPALESSACQIIYRTFELKGAVEL